MLAAHAETESQEICINRQKRLSNTAVALNDRYCSQTTQCAEIPDVQSAANFDYVLIQMR